MTEILLIKGSARRNGNSDTVLETAVRRLQQEKSNLVIETITASELKITPCRSCHGCWETGHCVINDTMQQVYKQCLQCDHIIVSAPVYFTSLPGHLKIMIDRFQCFWVRTYRLGNPPEPRRNGMFLCAGAMDDRRFFDSSSLILKIWMSTLNMKCNVAHFFPGVDDADAVDKSPHHLKKAEEAAEDFSQYF